MTDWIVKPLVSEDVYTDREEFLKYFHQAALKAATRRTTSTVLLGKRRMGKTEIFKRVVNRLFFEQDPRDPKAVVPVYFSFPDVGAERTDFAKNYIENFMRHYLAFYISRPEIIIDELETRELVDLFQEYKDRLPERMADVLLMKHRSIIEGTSAIPQKTAVETPRRISDIADTTVAMFLDEFQNTRLPQYDFDIVGFMQEAVESPTCPHFVTGSAMSILAREIIGRGSLFGRFDGMDIHPMTGYWGAMLAAKAAAYYTADVLEEMQPVISDRCGGNPFYINAVIRQAVKIQQRITDEETLNNILAVDISSGFIWGELNDQVNRWISRINEYGITKWVLYLSALDENTNEERRNELNIERIRDEIKNRDGKEVSIETIRDVLVQLSRGDLIEYLELGGWFRKVDDPILIEFLKVWGRIEVEGKPIAGVRDALIKKYQQYERRYREYKGYLAEVHMSQVLINGQDQTLPGAFFNSDADIKMPWRFSYVHHRVRLASGKGNEIDILGAAGIEKWVCQSKWISGKPVGVDVLKQLLNQADLVRKEMTPEILRIWLFAHDGLTKPGQNFAKKHNILWSSRRELDELLSFVGLRRLPDL